MFRFWLLVVPLLTVISAPVTEASTRWGQTLYDENCSACHGSKGQGGTGVPIGLPAFIDQVDDEYLHRTIRHGRPGRVMPPFPRLDDGQVKAIISYMRSWTGKPGPTFSAATIRGDTKKGAQSYKKLCAACHGEKGDGGKGTGVTYSRKRDLPIIAPALNNKGFLSSASDAMIWHTIARGRKGTPMPAFIDSLGKDGINNIVSYMRQFTPFESKADKLKEPAYIMRESTASFEQTVENVKNAVASANMRLIRVQNVEDKLFPENKVNQKQKIVYACGFNFLYEALKVDSRVGLFLPCRITILEHAGKVKIYTMNPNRLATYFNNDELAKLCSQMHDTYVDLLEEATM